MAKILVIEDDKFLQDVYVDTLKTRGHIVESADDGAEGLNKIRQGGWDLILIDIIIPKMNGLDVVQTVRNEPPPANLNKSIIFLTNLDKGEEIEKAKQLGNGYIIKSSITPGDLIERVDSYLAAAEKMPL